MVRIFLAIFLVAATPQAIVAGQGIPADGQAQSDILVEGEQPGSALYKEGDAFYEQGQVDRARANFSQACALDYLEACDIYGVMAMSGEGGSLDPEIASAAFQRSCLLGSANGCVLLSSLYLETDTPLRSAADARVTFERACTAGNASACTQEALFLFEGIGGLSDTALARTTMQKACDLGDPLACDIIKQQE